MDYLVILMILLSFSWHSGCNSDRLEQMEKKLATYDTLQQEVQTMKKTVLTMKKTTERLENRVHDLEAKLEGTNKTLLPSVIGVRDIRSVTTVAFSAFVDHNADHIGLDQPIPYNNIITNIGNGFSQHTHVFTCPVTGLYLFTFTICNEYVDQFVAKLVVDNQNIVDAISQPTILYEEIQASNTAIIQSTEADGLFVTDTEHQHSRRLLQTLIHKTNVIGLLSLFCFYLFIHSVVNSHR